jgi:S-adenosylmethionine:tRNA ribosyltransferase-isomerase
MKIPAINIDAYDYPLPAEKIAKYPLQNRDDSRLLAYVHQTLSESSFKSLPDLLPDNTLLVFNNTKVIRARLLFHKSTGARIEIFCLEPANGLTAEEAFQQTSTVEWICLVGNQKKWKEGPVWLTLTVADQPIRVEANVVQKLTDGAVIRFTWNGSHPFATMMEAMGQTPIPPYLERESEDLDNERYQTVYSKHNGSVAAPTAGLHFSPQVLHSLQLKGIKTIELTLHVGAGTFKPVKSNTIEDHEMHTEHFMVPLETLNTLLQHQGPIVAVGTTTVRTLESLYLAGVKMAGGLPCQHVGQWDGFQLDTQITRHEALDAIRLHLRKNNMQAYHASTAIIITPGYRFQYYRWIDYQFPPTP